MSYSCSECRKKATIKYVIEINWGLEKIEDFLRDNDLLGNKNSRGNNGYYIRCLNQKKSHGVIFFCHSHDKEFPEASKITSERGFHWI